MSILPTRAEIEFILNEAPTEKQPTTIDLSGGMTPRASMNVTPKKQRSQEEWTMLETYVQKSIKRNKENGR